MKNLAVIFDMNGVIIDDIPYHVVAWDKFLESKGIKMDKVKFERDYNGRIYSEIIRSVLNQDLTDEEVIEYNDEKEKIYQDVFRPHLKPLPGLKKVLDELRDNKIPLGLATAAPPTNVEYTLNGTGLTGYFDTIVHAYDVSLGKPDPEIYNLTIEKMKVKPEQCVVFEDSLNGIDSAHAAGTKVIAVASTMDSSELGSAELVINDFTEITLKDIHALI